MKSVMKIAKEMIEPLEDQLATYKYNTSLEHTLQLE